MSESDFKNNIQLHKYSADGILYDPDAVQAVLNKFVNSFAPMMRVSVALPKDIVNNSPNLLYSRAAENRGHLDGLTTFLSGLLVFRTQIKHANIIASKQYKIALADIYKQQHPEIKAAKGYAEKELLARNYLDIGYAERKEFWEETLSDVDDVIEMVKVKMRGFKGGLDTILQQIALLKINANFKNLILSNEQAETLNNLRETGGLPKEEGECSFNDKPE